MDVSNPDSVRLITSRLGLRPTDAADAKRAFEIQSDWGVTQMLAGAAYPPDLDATTRWFAEHKREWLAGEAYRFAIVLEGRFIGVSDLESIRDGCASLGYWLERDAWGMGLATEAAEAVIKFAFEEIGLLELRAGHAIDNLGSARVLTKLGFQLKDTVRLQSRSRRAEISQCRYVLRRPGENGP